ncbi:MAG: YlbF family regulator [Oscillospiraceae bacterium]
MDAITTARELGKAIQNDERYLIFRDAEKANDNDVDLQEKIEKFNDLRAEINGEISKTERDEEKIKNLDAEFKALYSAIVDRPNMLVYNDAKSNLDKLLTFINQIIAGSVNGENPDEIEEQTGCSGSCSGCQGCH